MHVSGGQDHSVGLNYNGGVVACRLNLLGQCDVGGLTNIIEISAGEAHTVGVRGDGTVLAYDDDSQG